MHALVLGGGVVGLSVGHALLDAGLNVTIWAKEYRDNTTSARAGAYWRGSAIPDKPAAEPGELTRAWSIVTYERLCALQSNPAAGVTVMPLELVYRERTPELDWGKDVNAFRRLRQNELPPGYADGFSVPTPMVEMPLYLRFLESSLVARGGAMERRVVRTLDECLPHADVVVVCLGLGAREFDDGDESINGARGQVAVLEPAEDMRIEKISFDPDPTHLTYVVPRRMMGQILCGGTLERGIETEDTEPHVIQEILRRCEELVPGIRRLKVISTYAGVRPMRPQIRFEVRRIDRKVVGYLTGFGGVGVSHHWGAAEAMANAIVSLSLS